MLNGTLNITNDINDNPNWEFAGIYSDEGISGTELSHRTGMLSLIEDAKAGKVQLILVKSIARFARNVVDCLSIVQELKNYGVGVCFDENNLCTLGAEGTMLLTILATVAEEESRSKSFIMNWSIQRRFQNGIFLTPELLGYDKDENGDLVINESEAETVKVIYYLYINGWSTAEIADILTSYRRETKVGNTEWGQSAIYKILDNERHCGDVLAHKTYTPDFKTHKSVKNEGKLPKYRKRDHHEAIVSREVYHAAHLIRASSHYKRKKHALPVMSVIEDGVLRGYVPIDRNWEGFSPEDYQMACESVHDASFEMERDHISGHKLNLSGYQRVSGHFFPSSDDLFLTISGGRMRFNTACLKKIEDVEYVELLINTVHNCIAIRPCEQDNPNAIHWGRLKEDKWIVSSMSCRGLSKVLFSLMSWEDEGKYRFKGQFRSNGTDKLLVFELDEPVVTKTVEHVIVPEKAEDCKENTEEIVVQETVKVYPPSWAATFGTPILSIAHGSLLTQQHYSGDWDVLRPAKMIEEMNTLSSETLAELMEEAEAIMEGWEQGAKCVLTRIDWRCLMEHITWDHNDLGISFAASSGRITIFKTTLKALNYPPYFRFLLDTDHKQFGIECCGFASSGSHQLLEKIAREHYDIKSMDMVRLIYQTCGWNVKSTYRIKGIAVPDRRVVLFDLTAAMRVSEGRLME